MILLSKVLMSPIDHSKRFYTIAPLIWLMLQIVFKVQEMEPLWHNFYLKIDTHK
jgi:hypothetical protein